MKRRPVIGVTGPDKGGFPAWFFTRIAVFRAGGRAVRLRPGDFADGSGPPRMDGLVLGGGADVDPGRYDEDVEEFKAAVKATGRAGGVRRWLSLLLAPVIFLMRRAFSLSDGAMDRGRDAFEERCLEAALRDGLPVLGICRGSQFINVCHGGTLHRELTGFYGERGNISTLLRRKNVGIVAGSRLEGVLGSGITAVNSLHRQAVARLGDQLTVAARDEAGVVQAIEKTAHPFLIGVQWHPEYLPLSRLQQGLFRQLVRLAGGRREDPM